LVTLAGRQIRCRLRAHRREASDRHRMCGDRGNCPIVATRDCLLLAYSCRFVTGGGRPKYLNSEVELSVVFSISLCIYFPLSLGSQLPVEHVRPSGDVVRPPSHRFSRFCLAVFVSRVSSLHGSRIVRTNREVTYRSACIWCDSDVSGCVRLSRGGVATRLLSEGRLAQRPVTHPIVPPHPSTLPGRADELFVFFAQRSRSGVG
jgi:hypothetical protein